MGAIAPGFLKWPPEFLAGGRYGTHFMKMAPSFFGVGAIINFAMHTTIVCLFKFINTEYFFLAPSAFDHDLHLRMLYCFKLSNAGLKLDRCNKAFLGLLSHLRIDNLKNHHSPK